jgi:D-alanyl-D-alanine carboxypeptidase
VCVAKGNATATQLVAAVQDLMATKPLKGVIFGAWIDGKPIVTGALGEALDGVPATRQDHTRIGNAAEAMETTLFLRLVDQGKLSLDDTVSKWFPQYPNADKVTLQMLASSTSGYPDFVTSQEFVTAFDADPFRHWTPEETLDIAMKLPMVFEPGTSWAFSDTNFVLLGQVITKATGTPYEQLIKSQVYDKVGMPNTTYSTGPTIAEPVLHSYSGERGVFEEATYWSPSWVTYGATATSTLDDLARFSTAWGKGTLLTKQSHELQTGPANVGKGPLTANLYYAMGTGYANGWTLTNPQMDGYSGVISYFPPKKATVVVFATFRPGGDATVQYAGMVFNAMAAIIAPDNPPKISTCPRGDC